MVEGKNGIYAKVLADSICPKGNRLTTFEVSYPRIILAELNTHQMLPKNSASSRAIPFAKMSENLTGAPVRFGANQSGMQDKGEDYDAPVYVEGFEQQGCGEDEFWIQAKGLSTAEEAWEDAKSSALNFSKAFHDAGYHKQVYNRLTEPYQMMKTVISGTEWDNFFWLRNDEAADPTIAELACCMQEEMELSIPDRLQAGMWHLPYVDWYIDYEDETGNVITVFTDENGKALTIEEAITMSVARTAAVSFRNVDYDLEKCQQVFDRLLNGGKIHGSAFAHAAKVMDDKFVSSGERLSEGDINVSSKPNSWEEGITHMDREGNLWSAHYKGFIQYRKLIKGENYVKPK